MSFEYYIYLGAKKEESYEYKSHFFGALLLAVNGEKKNPKPVNKSYNL